jgi:hypothetical protein
LLQAEDRRGALLREGERDFQVAALQKKIGNGRAAIGASGPAKGTLHFSHTEIK